MNRRFAAPTRTGPVVAALVAPALLLGAASLVAQPSPVESVALRVHDMEAMEAFYAEAFDVRFRTVRTGPFESRFGELGPVLLKLVPIRDAEDFEGYPVLQLGLRVDDPGRIIEIAEKHGGRVESDPVVEDGRVVAAVRDPDGNTIELYGPRVEGA